MSNKQGEFIWYELMTSDIEAARTFYQSVVGWQIAAQSGMPDMDYRMIDAGDGQVGGMMQIDEEMQAAGGQPLWIGYIGVDDVDATAAAITAAGGQIFVPPTDIPGVGRFAMAADPQGAPFYVMRGAVEGGVSTAFSSYSVGHFAWNELSTPDPLAALEFYGRVFGWTNPNSMPMGELGEYRFLNVGDLGIGAVQQSKEPRAAWLHYAYVPSISQSVKAVKEGGGTVLMGPHEVPGGGSIITGTDPQGARFALAGRL